MVTPRPTLRTHTRRRIIRAAPPHYSGEFVIPGLGEPWVLGQFGDLRLSISYYIDALTVCMFCMVSFIATLIHVYAMGYMHVELHDVTDQEVTTSDGSHVAPPGPLPRVLPIPVAVQFQHAGPGAVRQCGHGLRVLGAGGDLLLLPHRLLYRAAQCNRMRATRPSSSIASAILA